MLSVTRRSTGRLAVAALTFGLAAAGAIGVAGPAAADEVPMHRGGATATLGGLKTFDQAVIREGGKAEKIGAGLFEMSVDNGGTLQSYCIDIHNPTQDQAKYQEVPWKSSSLHDNPDAGKIRWILQHSYPQINDLDRLAEAAGTGTLSEKTAAAGTQVAIWRYSDHIRVDAVDPQAEKLADYLYKAARTVAEPRASLTLDPPAIAGKTGKRLGPVTVRTNASSVTVAPPTTTVPSGVKVVGSNGKPITRAVNGTKLFLDVPAESPDGTAGLTAEASAKVPVGRAFTGVGQHTKSQTQILAGSSESTVSAKATAVWARSGAIPAVSARQNCAKGGVDVMVANKGDAPFTYTLAGREHTVGASATKTVTVPAREDQAYRFTLVGPDGLEKTFAGALDCQTVTEGGRAGDASTVAGGGAPPTTRPSPAATDGPTGDEVATPESGDLADTGSSSPVALIAGIAGGLLVVGGGALFLVRRKRTAPSSEPSE
ncbi:Cys-Gln thioester bond-forming surface protein [Streptomyces buecherae]|uniref:Cys-Gln thioester bond-forming surface protein n=1 Tax=Streptomyces buecherae TaxID=2763006 RepID=UPI0036BAEA8C